MLATRLTTLSNNPVFAEAVAFINRMTKGGVPLDSITCTNPKEGLKPTVIIIPKGKEASCKDWKQTQGFSARNAGRILGELGYAAAAAEIEAEVAISDHYVTPTLVPTADSSQVVRNPLNKAKAHEALIASGKFRVRQQASKQRVAA